MTQLDAEALLDQPGLLPAEVIEVEELLGRTLRTTSSIVLCQAEAVTLLEAVASSVGGPGSRVLNVVTGPYGVRFGDWLRRTGAQVTELAPGYGEPVTSAELRRALAGVDTVALTQAEAATGARLDLRELLGVAREAGVLTVVDAVAAIGAEPIAVDEWGIDVAIIGAQKALAGPAGVSAAAVSERAWRRIEANPVARRGSTLSLLDWATGWLRTDRSRIPGTPAVLETRALLGALRRVHREGIRAVELRHRRAAAASVAGVKELGLLPWVRPEARASICTAVALPEPLPAALAERLRPGSLLSPGDGLLANRLFRINHSGRAAALDAVLEALERLAAGLGLEAARLELARRAAASVWAATP